MTITKQKSMSWNKIKFKTGQKVRIIDSEKETNTVYTIKEVKKSYDGNPLYLLETKSNPIKILFYPSEKAHLEKV